MQLISRAGKKFNNETARQSDEKNVWSSISCSVISTDEDLPSNDYHIEHWQER